VGIHTGEKASDAARALNSRAFALGNNIVFNRGNYSPGTEEGKKLIAHELTHVVQQTHGNRYVQRVVSGIQAKLVVGQPGDKYKQGVDRVTDAVMRMPEPEVQRQPEEGDEPILLSELHGATCKPIVEFECDSYVLVEDTTPEKCGGGQGEGYICFGTEKTNLDSQDQDELDKIRDYIRHQSRLNIGQKANAYFFCTYEIDIVGRADYRDQPSLNLELAKCRANAVEAYYKAEFGAGSHYNYKVIIIPAWREELDPILEYPGCERALAHHRTATVAFKENCEWIYTPDPGQNSAFVKQLEPPKAGEPAPSAPSSHVGIIPIAEFIKHIEVIERSYPSKSPKEILTMIRSLYYGSPAGSPGFDRLIPDAPNTGAVQTCTDSEGSLCKEPVGTCTCVYAHGLSVDTFELQAAVCRLRQRANENEIADNPSPYIKVGNDIIDIGHVLVGVDAILHPSTTTPFSSHGLIYAPGPATWVGDIGAAMVFLKEHHKNGHKSDDVKGNLSATIEDYYKNSMPMSDLLGDVDAFGVAQMVGRQTLSTALRYYYVGESGGSPLFRYNRWCNFAAANNLTYTEAGNKITWKAQARQIVIERTTQFANLFAGRKSPIRAMTIIIPPQKWDQAGAFADRFLKDVKHGLEEEITHNAVR